MADTKPIHTIVLDTGAIIRNHPTVSSLIAQSEQLVTVPAILSEIKDEATRIRFDTTIRPFLDIRTPAPKSIAVITDFARRTGDLSVLSGPDIQIIALAYELECERNGGDWRLRRMPGQKSLNGKPPGSTETKDTEKPIAESPAPTESPADAVTERVSDLKVADTLTSTPEIVKDVTATNDQDNDDDDDDDQGWITPSNLAKRQAQDTNGTAISASAAGSGSSPTPVMQVATITTDFAMQNVILRMNLNLLSADTMRRISQLKTYILRCHGCFTTTREMDRQFCGRCGKPTLTRVSCSTLANGTVKLHLKKNMQWNHRGDRYSIPKAVAGSAHGRVTGAGKGHWGNELILAEDQKEYVRAVEREKKEKVRDLMDAEFLPGILTGDRNRSGGRVRVGAGRNVNSKKR